MANISEVSKFRHQIKCSKFQLDYEELLRLLWIA